jgi:hypothetical protein
MLLNRRSRRFFLKGAAGAAASGWLSLRWLVSGGAFFAATPARAAFKSLSESEAKSLMFLTRAIFPHAHLDDKYYWKVVEGIDGDMAGSADLAREIKDGLAKLDQASGGRFSDLGDEERARRAESIADSGFFGTVKGKAVGLLYNNKDVWPHFGYQGSSWEQGGYLHRGFDDLQWLS